MTPQEFDRTQRRYLKIFKGEDSVDNGDDAEMQPAPMVNSAASHLADLAVEAGIMPDRTAALRFLLRTRRGGAVLQRLGPHLRKRVELAREEKPLPTAKQRTDTAAKRALGHITEHAFTDMVMDYAKQKHPDLPAATAFAKVFEAKDDEGVAIRQTRQMIKQRQWRREHEIAKGVPVVNYNDTRTVTTDDWRVAYNQLVELRDELRRKVPYLTVEQAFSQIYNDPQNQGLVAAERAAKRRELGA
jgi:hypothetical protein